MKLLHQTVSTNRVGTMLDMCERHMPPRNVAVHTIPDSLSWRQEKQFHIV